jgi:hypothetical protein
MTVAVIHRITFCEQGKSDKDRETTSGAMLAKNSQADGHRQTKITVKDPKQEQQ